MKKSFLHLTFACLLLFAGVTGMSARQLSGGSGTVADPFLIKTAQDLDSLSQAPYLTGGYYFQIDNDIDLTTPPSPSNFPIGSSATPFNGTIDGKNRSIKNYTTTLKGVFDVIDGATIKNLYIINTVSTAGSGAQGALANTAKNSTIENCNVVGGSISGSGGPLGGLVGQAETVIIKNCYSTIAVTSATNNEIGGLVGYVAGTGVTSIQGSNYTAGTLTGTDMIGGLVGHVDASAILSISGSFASATFAATGRQLGGLIGKADGTINITGSYALGSISAGTQEIGGLVGTVAGATSIITGSFSTVVLNIPAAVQTGGLVGFINADGVEISSSSVNATAINGTSQIGGLVGEINGSTTTGTTISNSYAGVATLGGTSSTTEIGGLIGRVSTLSTISNSYARDTTFTTSATATYLGGLIGHTMAATTVNGCYAVVGSSQMIGTTNLGGLIGSIASGTITNSFASFPMGISGAQYVGGLVGNSDGALNIFQSYATSNITLSNSYVGGLVGRIMGVADIQESYSNGNVTVPISSTGQSYIGGLIGGILIAGSTVNDCYASGELQMWADVNNTSYIGGLVAYNQGSITNSFANGGVNTIQVLTTTNSVFNIGGLVGQNAGLIDNCIAYGAIDFNTSSTAIANGGGLVGDNSAAPGTTISNSLAANFRINMSALNINRISGSSNGTFTNNRANSALVGFTPIGTLTNVNGLDATSFTLPNDPATFGASGLAWDASHWDYTGPFPVLKVTNPVNLSSVTTHAQTTPVINVPAVTIVCNGSMTSFNFSLTGDALRYDWTHIHNGTRNPGGFSCTLGTSYGFPVNSISTGQDENYQMEVIAYDVNGIAKPAVTFNMAKVVMLPTAQILAQGINLCDNGTPLDTTIFVTFTGASPWSYGFVQDVAIPVVRLSINSVDSVLVTPTSALVNEDAVATIFSLDPTVNGVVDGNGCMATAATATDTIYANPVYSATMSIAVVGDTVVCNNNTIGTVEFTALTLSGTPTIGQWELVWENMNGRSNLIGMPAGNGTDSIPTFIGINSMTVNARPDSAIFNVYAKYTNNNTTAICKGSDIMPLTLQVNPIPVVSFTNGIQAICNNSLTDTITFNTNVAASSDTVYYLWRNHDTTLGFVTATQGTDSLNNTIYPFTVLNAGMYPIMDTITVTPYFTNMATCMGDSMDVVITMDPTTTINIQPRDATLCGGEVNHTIAFDAYGTDLSFQWYEKPKYGGAWTAIENATQNSLDTYQSGSYLAIVTSGACNNVITDTVDVEFGKAPYILGLQDSIVICANSDYTLAVVSNADSLQWYYEGMAISGAIVDTISIINANPDIDYGVYSVKGYSACRDSGEVATSQVGYLWVATPIAQPITIEGLDDVVYTGQTYTAHVGNPSYGFNDVTNYTWTDSSNSADFLLDSGANQHTVEVIFDSEATSNTVTVTLDHVCAVSGAYTATKVVKVEKGTAIDGVNVDATVVYPSPFDSELFVSSESNILSVKIFDVNGNLVVNQAAVGTTKVVIPVGSLIKGTYLVKVETANGAATYKVVK